VNIRLALACTAVGALAAGGAIAQDRYSAAYHRCDRANPSRTPHACNRAARAYYQTHPYAAGYNQGYPNQAYYPAYDDSDFYGPYGQDAPPPAYYSQPDQGYYPPPAEAYGAPAAYEGPDVAPVIVPGRRYYWEHPGDTSPAAQYSVRLHGYVNPHSSVTAIPTPNNVSDQVPSHGYDYDGVPPDYPY
jgi:hypothetical protein